MIVSAHPLEPSGRVFTFCSSARAPGNSSSCGRCGIPPWYSMGMVTTRMVLPIIGVPVKGSSLDGEIRCIDHVPLLMSFSQVLRPWQRGILATWRSTVAVTWCIRAGGIGRGRLHRYEYSSQWVGSSWPFQTVQSIHCYSWGKQRGGLGSGTRLLPHWYRRERKGFSICICRNEDVCPQWRTNLSYYYKERVLKRTSKGNQAITSE